MCVAKKKCIGRGKEGILNDYVYQTQRKMPVSYAGSQKKCVSEDGVRIELDSLKRGDEREEKRKTRLRLKGMWDGGHRRSFPKRGTIISAKRLKG